MTVRLCATVGSFTRAVVLHDVGKIRVYGRLEEQARGVPNQVHFIWQHMQYGMCKSFPFFNDILSKLKMNSFIF